MPPQDNEPQFHLINNKKSSNKWKIVLIVAGLVLLTALAIFAYLWWQEKAASRSLQTQLNAAQQENQKNAARDAQPAPAQAKYSATVGKFTLTLGGDYYIIIDLDGPFEGGPATRLAVGTKNATGEQTVNSASHARVTVDAYPLTSDSYANRVKNETDSYSEKKKLENVKVADTDAEAYELNGLSTDKKLFFTKNDIVYVITAHSSDTIQTVLDDVIEGFKFN